MRELTPTEPTIQKPSRQYFLQEYPITIEFMARGCVIKVGCKSIPFEDIDMAMKALAEYVENPDEMQNKWRQILS